MTLARYVGKRVLTKVDIPSDRRGHMIPAGTILAVERLVGEQHFHLAWPNGGRAANQVHYKCLETGADEAQDVCGFCGKPGADKFPHPVRWPGEQSAKTELVHASCEQEECHRAHAELSKGEREAFLRRIIHIRTL